MNDRKLCPSVLTLPVLLALIITGCGGITTPTPASSTQANASKFMYTALVAPDGIGVLHINGDGSLSPLPDAPFPAPPGPDRILGNSQFIFVAGFGTVDDLGFCCQNQTVSTYTQDSVTGSLTQVASLRHDFLEARLSFVLHPTGRFLYAGNENGNLDVYAVAEDGYLSQMGEFDPRLGSLEGPLFHPNGRFLYVAGRFLDWSGIYRFEVDHETGLPVDVQEIDFPANFGIKLTPDGKFLLASNEIIGGYQLCSFKLDPVTGLPPMVDEVLHKPIPTACIPIGTFAAGIAFHPAGEFVVLSQRNSGPGDAIPGTVAVYRFDAGNFTAIPGASFVTGRNTETPRFSADGKFLFVLANKARSTLLNDFAFDENTGAITPVSGSPIDVGFVGSIFVQ
jgi:6-phosphogluconolactonase (cycloisomerase 2 family)